MNCSKSFTRHALLILIGVLILSSAGWAAEPSDPPLIVSDSTKTLDDLLDLALNHEYTYRKAVEGERIVTMLRASAIGQFLPGLSSSGRWSTTTLKDVIVYDNFGVPIGTNNADQSFSSFSVSASEVLFSGGQRLFGLAGAKLQLQNIFLNSERSRDVLIAQVKTVFYNFLLAKENLGVQNEILAQRNESLRLAQARFATGDVIELDVMQAEIDLGTQQNNVLQVEQSLKNAREALNLTVGIHLDSTFPVVGDLTPVLPKMDADRLVTMALDQRPDYKIAKNQVKINKLNVLNYTSPYLPTVSAFYSIERSYRNATQAGDYKFYPNDVSNTIGFSMNWTIFDRFQREYNRQNAVIAKRQSTFDENSVRQNIMANVRSEWRNLEKLNQQIKVSGRNRDLARRQLQLEQERYRIGASSQLNLRSAEVTRITAENDYLARVFEYFTTLATLERDLGASLEEVSR
ncbi:MAG: TolC family protein [bacterium]